MVQHVSRVVEARGIDLRDPNARWRCDYVRTASRARCELLHFFHRGSQAEVSGFVCDFFTDLFAKISPSGRVAHITTEDQFADECAVHGSASPNAKRYLAVVRERLANLRQRRPEILAFTLNEPGHFSMLFMRQNEGGQVEVFVLDSMFAGDPRRRWGNIIVGTDSDAAERTL